VARGPAHGPAGGPAAARSSWPARVLASGRIGILAAGPAHGPAGGPAAARAWARPASAVPVLPSRQPAAGQTTGGWPGRPVPVLAIGR